MNKIQRVNTIIHTTSVAAGGIGAGLAQTVAADRVALLAIQIPMVIAIAGECGVQLDKSSAIAMLGQQGAQHVGLYAATRLVVWIPGWGNAVNATVAATTTEALGWATYHFYSDNSE